MTNKDFVIDGGVLKKYSGTDSEVTIPDSVTSIGEYAFEGCICLNSVDVPNSVTSIAKGAFNGCTNLMSVNIPASVKYIGDSAFCSCSKLTFYCEAASQPDTWDKDWNWDDKWGWDDRYEKDPRTVVWDSKLK